MTVSEPIIVVLGPWCGGTSAVAKVLHHLGVLMGTRFDVGKSRTSGHVGGTRISACCVAGLLARPVLTYRWMLPTLGAKLRSWADNHRPCCPDRGTSARRQAPPLFVPLWISSLTPGLRLCRLQWTDLRRRS